MKSDEQKHQQAKASRGQQNSQLKSKDKSSRESKPTGGGFTPKDPEAFFKSDNRSHQSGSKPSGTQVVGSSAGFRK